MNGKLEFLTQFISDGITGKTNKEFQLNDVISNNTYELIKKYETKNFEEGNVVVYCNFSANGGNFEFYVLNDKVEKSILDFDIEDNIFKEMKGREYGILIEPFDYGNIQPYNRQQPYYFPHPYERLNKKEFDKFNLYMTKKVDFDQNTCKRLDKYLYNDYWKTISFDVLIPKNKLCNFMKEFLNIYQMNDLSNDVIDFLN